MKNYPLGTKFYHEGSLKYTLIGYRDNGGLFKDINGANYNYQFTDSLYYDLYGEDYKYYDVEYPKKNQNFTTLYNKLVS